MMLMRTVADKALPFDPLVPNAETIEAMKAWMISWPICMRTIRTHAVDPTKNWYIVVF